MKPATCRSPSRPHISTARAAAIQPWRLAKFLKYLGRARVGLPRGGDQDRFTLAEANFLEAYPIFAKAHGESAKDPRECAQGLVDLYTAWDNAEPGKGYDAKAAEWKTKLAGEPAMPGNN